MIVGENKSVQPPIDNPLEARDYHYNNYKHIFVFMTYLAL